MEWTPEKFKETLDLIALQNIPSSDVMLFYYCSTAEAIKARKSGIPSLKKFNGIPLTLRRPFDTNRNDFDVFNNHRKVNSKQAFPSEEVVVYSLPRQFIDPLPGYDDDDGLWVLSANVLIALRPFSFVRSTDNSPWLSSLVLLPPQCVVQSFRILENVQVSNILIEDDEITQDNYSINARNRSSNSSAASNTTISTSYSPIDGGDINNFSRLESYNDVKIEVLHSIQQLMTEMVNIRSKGDMRGLIPLYHYTSLTAAKLIMKDGFRMSSNNLSSKTDGVHFTTHGPACYGLGSEDYEVNIFKDFYGIGKRRSLDTFIVYGCCPRVLEKVITNILFDNVTLYSLSKYLFSSQITSRHMMVSKAAFGRFSLADLDGNFFLRPDHILGAFIVDIDSVVDTFDLRSADQLRFEIDMDCRLERNLKLIEVLKNENYTRIDSFYRNSGQLRTPSQNVMLSSRSARITPMSVSSSFSPRSSSNDAGTSGVSIDFSDNDEEAPPLPHQGALDNANKVLIESGLLKEDNGAAEDDDEEFKDDDSTVSSISVPLVLQEEQSLYSYQQQQSKALRKMKRPLRKPNQAQVLSPLQTRENYVPQSDNNFESNLPSLPIPIPLEVGVELQVVSPPQPVKSTSASNSSSVNSDDIY